LLSAADIFDRNPSLDLLILGCVNVIDEMKLGRVAGPQARVGEEMVAFTLADRLRSRPIAKHRTSPVSLYPR